MNYPLSLLADLFLTYALQQLQTLDFSDLVFSILILVFWSLTR
jgi:hypothetical protein